LREALRLSGDREAPDYSQILYLSPSYGRIKEARKTFHRLAAGKRGTYVPPLMFTPAQLAKKLCQAHSGRLVFPSHLRVPLLMRLSSARGIAASPGYSSLLADFILEVKGHFPGKNAEGLKEEVIGPAIRETGIPDEVAQRLSKAMELMELYDSFLSKNSFLDEGDAFIHAGGLASKLPFTLTILDGFYELTPAERLLIKEILEKAQTSFLLVPHDEKYGSLSDEFISFLKGFNPLEEDFPGKAPAPVRYYGYPSREEEVEAVARKLKAAFISGSTDRGFIDGGSNDPSRALFIFPPGTEYADMAERVFTNYGIPYSFPSGRNSKRRRRAGDLTGLFHLFGDESAPYIARLLSSPFFKDMPESLRGLAPKITLRGITGGLDELLLFSDAPKEDLKWLKRKLSPLRKAPQSFSGFVKKYLEVLRGLGFESPNFIDELEERLKSLALLDSLGECDEQDMREILEYAITSVPDEEEGAGVEIMPFGEGAAQLEPESLYFAGLKDGVIPARPEMDLFLPEKLRAALGLKTMKALLLKEEFLFKKLLSGSGRTHLSFPEMEGEKVFIPSIFISEGERLKDPVYGIFSKEEELLRKGKKEKDPYGASIKEIKVKGRKPKKLRVTDIDAYRACPRRFYIEKMLGVLPLEPARYEIEPRIAGTITHKVMERLCPIRERTVEELKERALRILDGILSGETIEPFWKDLLKESFLGILPDILEMEKKLQEDGYSFQEAELKMNAPLKGVMLSGKIDRIDRKEEGAHLIIDYKTGRLDLAGKDIIEKGANLQLLLYAEMSKRAGLAPSRVGIYSLKELKTRFIPGRTELKAGRTLEDYIEKALFWLEETTGLLKEGDFSARPLSDQTCRRCHEKPYCPYIHYREVRRAPEAQMEAKDGS